MPIMKETINMREFCEYINVEQDKRDEKEEKKALSTQNKTPVLPEYEENILRKEKDNPNQIYEEMYEFESTQITAVCDIEFKHFYGMKLNCGNKQSKWNNDNTNEHY